jgi:hypothetical protein
LRVDVNVSPDIAVVKLVPPVIFKVSPKLIVAAVELSSTKVKLELTSEPLAIFVSVLSGPVIVLFVYV